MLRSCKYCGRIHDSKQDCGHRPVSTYKRRDKEAGRYTYKFEIKSKEIKERSNYLCAHCLHQGAITYDHLETHHIVKVVDRPDLLLEDGNLICLCSRCHRKADAGEIDKGLLYALVRERDTPRGEREEKA